MNVKKIFFFYAIMLFISSGYVYADQTQTDSNATNYSTEMAEESPSSRGFFDDEDDDSGINIDDIKRYEEKNPPTFFKTITPVVVMHVLDNKLACASAAVAALGLSYVYRDFLIEHKKLIAGSVVTTFVAGFGYAWYKFKTCMFPQES